MPAVPCKPAGGSSGLMIPSAPALLRHRCSQCGGPHHQEASPSRWPRLFVLALKPTGTGSVESDYSACLVSTLIVLTSFKCQLLNPSQLKGLVFLSASTRVTCRIALRVSTDDVLGSGPGVHGRQEQQLEQEMLRRGLSGQRQPPEVLLHQSV